MSTFLRRTTVVFALFAMAACSAASRSGGVGGNGDKRGDGGIDDPLAIAEAGRCETKCSSDLHSVLDCDDKVVETCADDEGCGAGACVPACEAATLNKTTVGCEYLAHAPFALSQGGCYTVYVANTWGAPVTIEAEYDGKALNLATSAKIPKPGGVYAPLPKGELPPGEVAILFLAQESLGQFACPVTPAITNPVAVTGSGKGKAFRITASAPVVAYDMYPFGGGSSAITAGSLLLPTSVWDVNYVAVDAFKGGALVSGGSEGSTPWITVVATESQTNVTISPTTAIVGGGGLAAAPKGQPVTYKLAAGEFLQLAQLEELVGSAIESDKPIGVFGGTNCMNIPAGVGYCDSAHQQIPPVKALGYEYAGVAHGERFAGIPETVPWRIVGAVDGTELTYEPKRPLGAPDTINSGEVVQFETNQPFVVRSQDKEHPFYMAQYMTGCQSFTQGSGDCRGDPEFVNVVATEQYLSSYVFFTDPTYPETSLVVVRKKLGQDFADVELDCAGTLGGWAALGSSDELEFTRVQLVTGNFAKVKGCDNGRREMKSDGPFGVTVWGWGSGATTEFSQAVSYAYPAGMSVKPINQVVVPATPK